jgi:hypothetical protein
MVFQNPNQKISKASKTTYEVYANKMGIVNVAKKEIPVEWMAECLKPGEKPQDPKRFFV